MGDLGGARTSPAIAATDDGQGRREAQTPYHGPRWMCIGKHLCGAATDFALRACLGRNGGFRSGRDMAAKSVNSCTAGEGTSIVDNSVDDSVEGRFDGLAIAPCCHHR